MDNPGDTSTFYKWFDDKCISADLETALTKKFLYKQCDDIPATIKYECNKIVNSFPWQSDNGKILIFSDWYSDSDNYLYYYNNMNIFYKEHLDKNIITVYSYAMYHVMLTYFSANNYIVYPLYSYIPKESSKKKHYTVLDGIILYKNNPESRYAMHYLKISQIYFNIINSRPYRQENGIFTKNIAGFNSSCLTTMPIDICRKYDNDSDNMIYCILMYKYFQYLVPTHKKHIEFNFWKSKPESLAHKFGIFVNNKTNTIEYNSEKRKVSDKNELALPFASNIEKSYTMPGKYMPFYKRIFQY